MILHNSAGSAFKSLGAAILKVLSPKVLSILPLGKTKTVLVAHERKEYLIYRLP